MPCLNTRTLIILLAISQLMIACSVPQQATKPAEGESLSLVPQDYDRAIGAIKAGKVSEAEKLFSNIASSQPEFSNAHTNLGLIYLNKKQFDKAQEAFNKAISLNPNDAIAYNHLGVIHREKGEFNESRTMYQNAIKLKSDYAIAHLNLGILYDLYLHDLQQALEQYQNYQKMTNNNDKLVDKWIIDLEQRIKSENRG